MNKIHIFVLVCVFIAGAANVSADVPAAQAEEVKHLLAFVKDSGCILSRNGTDYSAEKAVSHIEKKHEYFRDEIKSTEDFIEYSATKSLMSDDYYTVTCPGRETIKTRDWLLTELKKYRSSRKLH